MRSETLYRGNTSIWASIHENGDVRVESEDGDTECCSSVKASRKEELLTRLLSRLPRRGRIDLARCPAEQKDRLLLKLLKETFGGEWNAVRLFHDFAAAEGLEPGYFHWP